MEQPHVIVHPLPVQGHIKPMLCLAQLLSEAGLYTTFLITHHAQKRMANFPALTTQFPNIHFEFISDGFPDDHPRDVNSGFFSDIKIKTKPHFKQFLLSLKKKSENGFSPPVTCIIADGYVVYSFEVAEELRLPTFTFVSHGACFLQAYHSIPLLIQQCHLPFRDDNINYQIQCVPGLEGLLRRKNLPPVCLLNLEADNPSFQEHLKDILGMKRSSGVIINTFNDLEVQCLPHVATHFQKFYTVGPLHAFLNSKIGNDSHLVASHASLWKAEKKCIAWLDSQPLRSVLYVSFGTLARRSISQLLEFWHGLVDSGHRFLWVVRPDVILEEEGENVIIPEQLQVGAKENGYIVDWAPQEQVLAHNAVGGFLTHCGWNSILESIIARIPMICWPHTNDQNINTDLVCKVLKIGIELEAFNRSSVKSTVETLMGSKRKALQKSVDKFANCAQDGIGHGGSSNHNLEMLVTDIKKIKTEELKVHL
ncbi:7-deoxyloganetic acid glucosyltransferase [Ziziphus jujuba]|uniref:Glycosyltransferase n=1 Tax=Ziziphus jujuba TaxID=326968 RepID=A0A6P4AI84_ZIZJJ|nr:7-deoxyloganetic acid glucosyltransferase-like [Ziziphus jujuba]XP_060674529.1 7-deoxyloganetic acid glucosyltransferase [Ziziphus jujuba]